MLDSSRVQLAAYLLDADHYLQIAEDVGFGALDSDVEGMTFKLHLKKPLNWSMTYDHNFSFNPAK